MTRGFLRRHKAAATLAALAVAGAAAYAVWAVGLRPRGPEPAYGVTFSTKYAKELGLDWRKAYLAVLDDLKVRRLRIPIYWDEIEPEDGRYDWSEVDWMIDQAAVRGAEVILAVGRKVPRWPECHVPGWAAALSEDRQRRHLLAFLEAEVRRYRTEPAVRAWQVENEPLFRFGRCPPPDREFLKREIALVRSLDDRPVLVTDSGELSTWIRTATLGDVLGISMYRLVWDERIGELYWPVSPFWYTERINFISPVARKVIVSELQAEPWFVKPPAETPLDEQFETMGVERFLGNVEFARGTGVGEVYLWGVEWWYWLLGRGEPAFWDAARWLFS